jgi:hypothetical protein
VSRIAAKTYGVDEARACKGADDDESTPALVLLFGRWQLARAALRPPYKRSNDPGSDGRIDNPDERCFNIHSGIEDEY